MNDDWDVEDANTRGWADGYNEDGDRIKDNIFDMETQGELWVAYEAGYNQGEYERLTS